MNGKFSSERGVLCAREGKVFSEYSESVTFLRMHSSLFIADEILPVAINPQVKQNGNKSHKILSYLYQIITCVNELQISVQSPYNLCTDLQKVAVEDL